MSCAVQLPRVAAIDILTRIGLQQMNDKNAQAAEACQEEVERVIIGQCEVGVNVNIALFRHRSASLQDQALQFNPRGKAGEHNTLEELERAGALLNRE